MCTKTCKCYSGENGSIKELWESYGNQVLNPYLRTSDSKNGAFEGKNTYKFEWSDDPQESVHSFKQCYDTVIKPQSNFYSNMGYDSESSFFDKDGAYDFLLSIETDSCSGLCSARLPLFYLKEDISIGAPKEECLIKAID